MRIGVTGASGFVGRHVLHILARRTELDVIAIGRTAIKDLPDGITQIQCNIRYADEGIYARLGKVDVLIHLAWGGLPNYRSFQHFDEELPAHFRFLRRMVEEGLPCLLVTGTCYEYGMVSGRQCEGNVSDPSNPYGFAKASLLRQLQFLQERLPFRLTWARLFYMYGKGQAPSALYSLLCAAVDRGDTKFPMSGGEQLRDYLPVERVAAALAQLAQDQQNAGVINICSGMPVSIRRLVERWISENNWLIEPDFDRFPYPDYEPLAFWGARDKLDTLLG